MNDDRNLIFVFATPGAGKTTQIIPKLTTQYKDTVVITIDDIKMEITKELGEKKISFKKFTELKNIRFEEKLKSAFKSDKQNIIVEFPGIALDPKKLLRIYNSAESRFYKITPVFEKVDFKIARERVKQRAMSGGNQSKMFDDWQNKTPPVWKHLVLHLSVPFIKAIHNMYGYNK